MAETTNDTLTDVILAAMPAGVAYWKTVGGLEIVVASVAVLGNTLVGCTLLTNRQLKKNPNNILMANLAIVDSVFALVLFFTGYWDLTAGRYPFGEIACRFHMALMVSSSQASNNILAAMSVVKFIHVGFPFNSDMIFQPAVIGAVCVICWLPPFVWNTVLYMFSVGQLQFIASLCYTVYTDFVNVFSILCFFLVQLVTVVIATGLVLRIVRRQQRSIGVLTVDIAGAPRTTATTAGAHTTWKAVRTFVVIVTAFLLMQAPLYFVTIIHNFCQCLPYDLVYVYVYYPFNMNCFVNVFIYFYMEPRFRKAAVYLMSGGRYGQLD